MFALRASSVGVSTSSANVPLKSASGNLELALEGSSKSEHQRHQRWLMLGYRRRRHRHEGHLPGLVRTQGETGFGLEGDPTRSEPAGRLDATGMSITPDGQAAFGSHREHGGVRIESHRMRSGWRRRRASWSRPRQRLRRRQGRCLRRGRARARCPRARRPGGQVSPAHRRPRRAPAVAAPRRAAAEQGRRGGGGTPVHEQPLGRRHSRERRRPTLGGDRGSRHALPRPFDRFHRRGSGGDGAGSVARVGVALAPRERPVACSCSVRRVPLIGRVGCRPPGIWLRRSSFAWGLADDSQRATHQRSPMHQPSLAESRIFVAVACGIGRLR